MSAKRGGRLSTARVSALALPAPKTAGPEHGAPDAPQLKQARPPAARRRERVDLHQDGGLRNILPSGKGIGM